MDHRRILYIEPDADTAETVVPALQAVDSQSVHHAESWTEAETFLATESADCVVTEWELPTLSGTELLTGIRQAAPGVPVVCFTHRSAEIAAELFAFESTEYLQKQATTDQTLVLEARIQAAIERAGSTAEPASDGSTAARSGETAAGSQPQLEQYRTMVESVKDGVCILNSDIEFMYVNKAFVELTGYPEGELLGTPAAMMTTQENIEMAHDSWEELFAGEESAAMLTGEITTAAGEQLPIEVRMTPLTLQANEQVTICVVRDVSFRKDTEAMFSALYDAAHELLSVQSEQEIADIGIEAAGSAFGFEDAIVFSYDEAENLFRPLAHTPGTENNFPGLPDIDASRSSLSGRAFFESEPIATADMSELPEVYDPETPYRRAMFIPIGEHGVLFIGDTETGTTSEQTFTVAELLGATLAAASSQLSLKRRSAAHQETLAERTAELEALTHTNELVSEFGDQLFSATTRQEVETTVCSILAAFDHYEFAWIGAAEGRTDALTPRTSAGHDNGYLGWLSERVATDGRSELAEPTYRAHDTNTAVSVARISDDWQTAPWRKEALSRGYQSVLSIPLTYNEITYGILSVYAGSQDGFNEYTRTILVEFGRIIAYVIESTQTKRGLFADHRTEVDLELTRSDDILHRLAGRLGTTCSFAGVVPQSDDQSLLYFTTRTVSAESVEAAAGELSAIERLRAVTNQMETTLFEATVSGPVLARALVDCGVIPTEITTDGDRQQVVVTVPQTTDVRTVIERIHDEYPSTTVVSRRDSDRQIQTRETFQMQLFDQLTPRQQETLRAAYFARYFESPRRSTGTEVGQSLGISQPTFNYHLRAALKTLLTLLFDDREAVSLDT